MHRNWYGGGLAVLLAVPTIGWTERSWLAAAIQAQEARWAAQQDPRATRTARQPRMGNPVSLYVWRLVEFGLTW